MFDTKYNTIRFVDGLGRELFRIPDGGSIQMIYPVDVGKAPAASVCKYIDETHFIMDGKGFDDDGNVQIRWGEQKIA